MKYYDGNKAEPIFYGSQDGNQQDVVFGKKSPTQGGNETMATHGNKGGGGGHRCLFLSFLFRIPVPG